MGLDAEPAGDPDHLEAPSAGAARLGQLVAQRLDLLHRAAPAARPAGRPAPARRPRSGRPRWPGPRARAATVSPRTRRRARHRPRPAPGSPATQATSRSPKVWPWSRATRPCLHSSSRARKRTMISMRVVRWPVRVRKVARPRAGRRRLELGHGVGHGDRVHGHVVEVDGGTGRSAVARRKAAATWSGVTPSSRSGAPTARSSSSPAVRGTDRAACSISTANPSAAAA